MQTVTEPPVTPTSLVIDDEPPMRRLLKLTLEGDGYRCFEAGSGQDGLSAAAHRRPDVILLDLGLPDLAGMEVLRRLREWTQVPVVVLTARHGDADKVEALDAGADDFVTKPFSAAELLARLRAARRRADRTPEGAVFHAGTLVVDLARRQVTSSGCEVKLTPTEYALLRLLVRNAGRVLTQRQLLIEVWGPNHATDTHYLRVYMARLRDKLGADPAQPGLIRTEPGVGYRLVADPADRV
jgi:two-component system KDP operon response regulator KdpE